MDELAREFFKAMNNGIEFSEKDHGKTIAWKDAKAAASLCREKCKEVIKLARDWSPKTDAFGDPSFKFDRTEQEILDTLNKKP